MKKLVILNLCIMFVFSACKDNTDDEKARDLTPAEQQQKIIVDELSKNSELSTFAAQFALLDVSSMDVEAFTVFAVVNSAPVDLTSDVVKRHVVKGVLARDQLVDGAKFTSVDNTTLAVDMVGKAAYINSTPVEGNEIKVGNSVVYVLPRVMPAKNTATLEQQKLIIDELRKTENLQVFADRFESLDLSEIDTNAFTVFAIEEDETDEQGALSLTEDEIMRHIVAGAWAAGSLTDGMTLKTINNTELSVTVYNENKFLNGVLLVEDNLQIARSNLPVGNNIVAVASRIFPLNKPVRFVVDFKFLDWNSNDGKFFSEIGSFGYHAHTVSAYYRIFYSVNEIVTSRDTVVRSASAPTIVSTGERSNPELSTAEVSNRNGSNVIKFMAGSLTFPNTFKSWGWYQVDVSEIKISEIELEDGSIRATWKIDITARHTNGFWYYYQYLIHR